MSHAKQKGGSVINISSIAGLDRGRVPSAIANVGSKNAVNDITKVRSLELGVYNIRVNSISPGFFKSEITEGHFKKPWINKVAMKLAPLKTFGTSDPAITKLVWYLVHDSSEYVTVNVFIVDAGFILTGVTIFSSL